MMKRCIVLLFIIKFINPLYAQEPSAVITFEERVHNFGTILEKNGKVTHTFIFHNNGKTPVIINEIYSACGCIGKSVSKAPVKPGGTGKVIITFDPEYKSGFFSKEINVLSNNNKEYNRIWVEGNITPAEHPVQDDYPYNFGNGLYLKLKVMAFGYLKPGETGQVELGYANNTNKEMLLSFVAEDKSNNLKFINPGKIAPKAKGKLTFSYTMPLKGYGDKLFAVHPFVNNKQLTQSLDVKILDRNKLDQSATKPTL